MRAAVSQGDIVYNTFPHADRCSHANRRLNLFLGSGRAGACFDAYGLMHNSFNGRDECGLSNTVLMHADHWTRGSYGLDYWLPVARLRFRDGMPAAPAGYRQTLNIYEGRLETKLEWPGLALTLRAWFNPQLPDILALDVAYQGESDVPALLLAPEAEVATHYNAPLTTYSENLVADSSTGRWLARVKAGTADTLLALQIRTVCGEAALQPQANGMGIEFAGTHGRHLLLIGMAGASRRTELESSIDACRDPETCAARAAAAWQKRWGGAWVHLPHERHQALWARSVYYLLSNYAPDVRSPAPPMGWSANGWPLHFPQDLSFIHPALLRLGHLDIVRSWVEFYRRTLPDMERFARRVWGARGAMWAWEYPIGPGADELLAAGAPNWYQYEIHNAAYPARMARDAAWHLRDATWTREVAWPVVEGSARFFASVLQKQEDGAWGMHVQPSMGQDEAGGRNARNYLCALYGAQYTLQTASAMACELGIESTELAEWQRILRDGLAYERLYDAQLGLHMTCEGQAGAEMLGRQKHPVQLNPIIFLPLGEITAPVRNAYARRYDLCAGVRQGRYAGWTLAAYWLAAAHMGDAPGLLNELEKAAPGNYVDPDWIQIYESSGNYKPYYLTSHGLFLQAVNDALVTDYWGRTQLGAACPDIWDGLCFSGLRTAGVKSWSGGKAGARFYATSA